MRHQVQPRIPHDRLHEITNLILNAECTTRKEREEELEQRSRELKPKCDDSELAKIDKLLETWSQAESFIRMARVKEERDGIDAATHLYDEFSEMKKQRDSAELEAHNFSPDGQSLFWCRISRYRIIYDRNDDVALGIPTADYSDVKRELENGADVHKLVHRMPWSFQESYYLDAKNTANGKAYRKRHDSRRSRFTIVAALFTIVAALVAITAELPSLHRLLGI